MRKRIDDVIKGPKFYFKGEEYDLTKEQYDEAVAAKKDGRSIMLTVNDQIYMITPVAIRDNHVIGICTVGYEKILTLYDFQCEGNNYSVFIGGRTTTY